jgi:hypothetical protein
MDRQAPRLKNRNLSTYCRHGAFTRPMPLRVRMLVVMVPIVLDMTRHGPLADTASRPVLADTASRPY